MRTSRRSALALGAVGLGTATGVLAGCAATTEPGASPGAGADQDPDQDPDEALLDQARADLDLRLAAVVAAALAFPGLVATLAPLEAVHRAHRAVLDPDAPDPDAPDPATDPAPGAVPRTPRAALRRLRAGEEEHRLLLAAGAGAARSGALARLLGAMAAGVDQQLSLLPARPGEAR